MIRNIIKRVMSKEFLTYLIFGVLTTVVNYVVFIVMLQILGKGSALTANAVAFVAAVIFAYVTNKPFVFQSKSWHWKVVSRELVTFVGSRLATFGIEELGLFVCQDLLHMDAWSVFGVNGVVLSKLGLSVLVVILNYVFSKFFVFAKNERN